MSKSRHSHFPGQIIAAHEHDAHQLLYVERGVLATQTQLGVWVAAPHRAMWVPAGTVHEHRVYGNAIVHSLMFTRDDEVLTGADPAIVTVSPLVREVVIASTASGLPSAESDRLVAVLRDRLRRSDHRGLVVPTARDDRLVDACDLVTRDLSVVWTLPALARQVNSTERTLTRLFRAEMSLTYPQWRATARTFHAMVLLASGHTVSETAALCGWATPSAFIEIFKRLMGTTPTRFHAHRLNNG